MHSRKQKNKFPSKTKAALAAFATAKVASDTVSKMHPTIYVRVPQHVLQNTPVRAVPKLVSSTSSFSKVTVEGTPGSRLENLYYTSFSCNSTASANFHFGKPKQLSFINSDNSNAVKANDHFNISFVGFSGVQNKQNASNHRDVLLYSGDRNNACSIHFNSKEASTSDDSFTQHDFITIPSSRSNFNPQGQRQQQSINLSFDLVRYDSSISEDQISNMEDEHQKSKIIKNKRNQTKHLLTSDLSFRLLAFDRDDEQQSASSSNQNDLILNVSVSCSICIHYAALYLSFHSLI